MASGTGSLFSWGMTVLIFALNALELSFASYMLNRDIAIRYPAEKETLYFLPIVLFASIIGFASVVTGALHLCKWRHETHVGATISSVLAVIIHFFVFVFSFEAMDPNKNSNTNLTITLEVLVVLAPFIAFFYLVWIWASFIENGVAPLPAAGGGTGGHTNGQGASAIGSASAV